MFNSSQKQLLQAQLDYINEQLGRISKFQEDPSILAGELNKKISKLKRGLTNTIFNIKPVQQGTYPDYIGYNRLWGMIIDDSNIIFKQLNNLGNQVNNNYNNLQAYIVEIQSKVNNIKSLVDDYRIYSLRPSPGLVYLGDSFNNTSRIDIGSKLLNGDQCYFDIDAGETLLPIESFNQARIKQIQISKDSNGVVGNNNEYGTTLHKNLSDIIDRNPDTWFEYERVGDTTDTLRLKVLFTLSSLTVINNLTLTCINFGTRTWPKIIALDTSEDGKEFISIKDDLPIVSWGKEDEENIFDFNTTINPGKLSCNFTPRMAKYVRLSLEQTSSYIIDTVAGQKERLAIGIRDLEINSYKFKSSGEFVSKDFIYSNPIKKLAIATNQNPERTNSIGSLVHSVSFDSGQSWQEIGPIQLNSSQEILNTTETVGTDSKIVKYKSQLIRNPDGFNGTGLSSIETPISEVIPLPVSPPYKVTLNQTPIEGSLRVLDPLGGSVGDKDSLYYIGQATTDNQSIFELPFDLSVFDYWENPIHVAVGYSEWTQVGTFSGATSDNEVFVINKKYNRLIFGNGTNGKKPTIGVPIFLWFDRERVYIDLSDTPKIKLNFSTTGVKDKIRIYREARATKYSQTVSHGKYQIKLDMENLLYSETFPITITYDSTLGSYNLDTDNLLDFIDGSQEFYDYDYEHTPDPDHPLHNSVNDRKFSIDLENGIIYLPYDSEQDGDNLPESGSVITIDFYYHGRNYLDNSIWSFGQDESEILIPKDQLAKEIGSLTTSSIDNEALVWSLVAQDTIGDIIWTRLYPKSLQFKQDDGTPRPEWTEVGFIDGIKEFESITNKAFYYSVDYKHAVLYSAETPFKSVSDIGGITGYKETKVEFQFTNYFAEYQIGSVLEEDIDWTLDGKNVTLTEAYGLSLSSMMQFGNVNGYLRFIYKYIKDARQALKQLESFYSPVLKEYKLIAVT